MRSAADESGCGVGGWPVGMGGGFGGQGNSQAQPMLAIVLPRGGGRARAEAPPSMRYDRDQDFVITRKPVTTFAVDYRVGVDARGGCWRSISPRITCAGRLVDGKCSGWADWAMLHADNSYDAAPMRGSPVARGFTDEPPERHPPIAAASGALRAMGGIERSDGALSPMCWAAIALDGAGA